MRTDGTTADAVVPPPSGGSRSRTHGNDRGRRQTEKDVIPAFRKWDQQPGRYDVTSVDLQSLKDDSGGRSELPVP